MMDKRVYRGMILPTGIVIGIITVTILNDTSFTFGTRNALTEGSIEIVKHELMLSNTAPSIRAYLSQSSTRNTSFDIANCSDHLGPNPADDLAKIDSYNFSSVQEYIKELFPPLLKEPSPPKLPYFVTAFSSNHFTEGMALIKNLNEMVRPKYKDLKVILYDIGLSPDQIRSLTASCACEIRKFDFEKFPKHVRILHNFAWKTIILQMVAVEHPFVAWMDTSVRFKTGNLDQLFEEVKQKGIMAHDSGISTTGTAIIPERTHENTFKYLHENPCTFAFKSEHHGGILFIYANQFITKYFLRPWVSCALSFGCMDPVENSYRFIPCPNNKKKYKFHLCHRNDQSVLGILMSRLFHRELYKYNVKPEYFMFCRSVIASKQTCYLYPE